MNQKNLSILLDALTETSVYVIEEATHKLLYFNQRCAKISQGRAVLGIKCHDIWPEVCTECPLKGLKDSDSNHIVCFDPLQKTTVDVTANRINLDGVVAVVLMTTPHKPDFEEQQGSEKIKQMYAQSLVTVFDECIIANLTADYYVNCQKDRMWTNIPEQGRFGVANLAYSETIIHPDDLDEFVENFSRESMLNLFSQGKKQISKCLRRLTDKGVYRLVEFTATRLDQTGDDDCWCSLVFRDVQDEYFTELQRNVEISQLAIAARTAYQMLISVNLTKNTYKMLEYNRSTSYNPGKHGVFDELIEGELTTVHPDYRKEFADKFLRDNLINAYNNGERIISMEVPHLGQDGVYHWNFTQVVKIESTFTDDLIEITLSRNIDEERRLQEEALSKEQRAKQLLEDALKRAEHASRAKNDFLSRMSHDIRTPMNAIVGMTELAQVNLDDKEKLKDYLQKISSSGKHLLGLINEVLDVSKIESGAVQLQENYFDLKAMVDEVIEMVRFLFKNKNQTFIVDIKDGIYTQVKGDERRLKQVLTNVLENASKYTPELGTVEFSFKEMKKNEPNIGAYRFVIKDNGIGMKADYLNHIFEPFSRADDSRISKVAGTGLGMTIVKNIIDMMGGDIKIDSEYGKGSKFTITVCLAKTLSVNYKNSLKADYDEQNFSGLRILLAEDNELNRQIAIDMLELLGVKVETVENGQTAFEAVMSHPPFYYDMVFMDIQMPVMNGYDATKKIRSSGLEGIEELPIVAMTADAFPEDARRALFAGMNDHIPKPISIQVLKDALSSCIKWKKRNHRL